MNTVILDRDGVINQDSDAYIKSPDEWIPIPGSLEAIAQLKQAGYRVLVATKQYGLARGLFDLETLSAIHQKMNNLLDDHGVQLDGIYYCPHGPDDGCDCRKPKPGLISQIQEDQGVDPDNTVLIGDSLRDLQAAQAMNIKPVLVLTGKGTKTAETLADNKQIEIYPDLAHCVEALLARPDSK